MKFLLPWASLALTLALSACAVPETQPSSPLAASAGGPQADVVCFFEAPTGTNRKVRRCMSKEEYKQGVESAQRLGNDIKAPPPPPQ